MSGANRTTQFLFSETEALQIKLRVLTDEVIEFDDGPPYEGCREFI